MGRGVVFAMLLAACAPHFDRAAHSGRDGEPWGARRVALDDGGEAMVRGRVTARGGDAVDWYAFEVPPMMECPRVEVELRYQTPRPKLHVAFAVYDRAQHLIAVGRGRRDRRERAATMAAESGGHYFAKVYAPGADDAGAYVLDVHAAQYGCDLPPPPPIYVRRPVTYQPPALAPSLDREIAGVGSIDAYNGRGEVVLDTTAVEPGWTGHLVDDHGAEVAGSAFVITQVRADASVAALIEPGPIAAAAERGDPLWTAVIPHPPPGPTPWPATTEAVLGARLVGFRGLSTGDVELQLDRGRFDGVTPDWRGELIYPSGVRVPGGHFTIVEVDARSARALAPHLVITDRDHLRAILIAPR